MLVTRTDLRQWADRKEFQGRLPHLIRRLAHAGLEDIERIGFPAGDGTAVTGLDGIVVVPVGNAWVPAGCSIWEMGTNQDHKSKATSDYKKRTEGVSAAGRASSTFVFVTPRPWDGNDKQAWIDERTGKGEWADVRAYSCDDLEEWIEQAPAVGVWLATIMGKYPPDLEPLSEWWEEWSSLTVPPFPPAALLAGREAAVADVTAWLQGPPSVLTIVADTREEAFAFAVASLLTLADPFRTETSSRSVIVKSKESLRQIEHGNRLVLLLDFDDPAGGRAVRRGHHVLRADAGRSRPNAPSTIVLPHLDEGRVKASLVSAGLGEAEAERAARSAGSGIAAVRRAIEHPGLASTPAWAEPASATTLASLVVLPEWTARDGDQVMLEKITGVGLDAADRLIARWEAEADAPLGRVGGLRAWASQEDAWQRLSPYLQSEHLRRFADGAVEVLREVHPRFDLPEEYRYMASVHGRVLTHSEQLRRGLAKTVGRLGAASAAMRSDGYPRDVAASVVRRVLEAPAPWQLWATLDRELPLLAEAAPDEFLDAVEGALGGDLTEILYEEGGMVGGCNHSGLLWALELLAWSPEYLSRVTLLLGRLAEKDPPEQRYANRPAGSLRQIFLSWHPQTAATIEQRFLALDVLANALPAVAFTVLKNILPTGMSTAFNTCKPRWRGWRAGSEEQVTHADVHAVYLAVVPRLLKLAEASRWADVAQLLQHFGPAELQLAVAEMKLHIAEGLGSAHEDVRGAIRSLLHSHRRFSNAKWRMRGALLSELQSLYDSLEPEGTLQRLAWLFADRAALPTPPPDDWQKEAEELELVREEAGLRLLDEYGAVGLCEHTSSFGNAWYLGRVLARRPEAADRLPALVSALVDEGSDPSITMLVGICQVVFVQARADALGKIGINSWPEHTRVRVLVDLPFSKAVWDMAEGMGDDIWQKYWKLCPAHWAADEDVVPALKILLEVERPFAALQLARMSESGKSAGLASELLERILREAMKSDPRAEPGHLGTLSYSVNLLLSRLESAGTPEETIAQLELGWLPVLAHEPGRPRALLAAVSRDPALFMELVSLAFRAKDEEPKGPNEVTEEQANRARLAYDVLRKFRWVPPETDDRSKGWSELVTWYDEVRTRAGEAKRSAITDIHVGEALAWVPPGNDGHWPIEAVRRVLEATSSRGDLETGLRIGVANKRGVTSRAIGEGGKQERELAASFRKGAQALAGPWPATAVLLRKLAEDYEREATGEDVSGEIRERRYD